MSYVQPKIYNKQKSNNTNTLITCNYINKSNNHSYPYLA